MTELKASITLDTHVIDHTIKVDQDVPKDKRVALIAQVAGQWSSIGITDYDEKTNSATHYPPNRIKEIRIELIEKLIVSAGTARVIEGQLAGVATRVAS